MNNFANKKLFSLITSVSLLTLSSCFVSKGYKISAGNYASSYDDTTLAVDNSAILLPYNRFIDPAGTVVRFGKVSLENHSLDVAVLPQKNQMVVEDRYGLAFIDYESNKLLFHLDYANTYKGFMSTFSGIKVLSTNNVTRIFWGAANPTTKASFIMDAVWDGTKAYLNEGIAFEPLAPAPMSLPNDIALKKEGGEDYLYVVLNGNSQLVKLRLRDKKPIWTTNTGMAPFGITLTTTHAYVTNWAGPVPTDPTKETAGIPYGKVYVDPRTGATAVGSVSVIDLQSGKLQTELEVGLHPNAIVCSKDEKFVYLTNGNSDNVSVISTTTNKVIETIPVGLNAGLNNFIGASPNALTLDNTGSVLYVANGMDNAIAVVQLGVNVSSNGKGSTEVKGFIPTEAYPSGLVINNNKLLIANLEGEGARASTNKRYSSHQQEATVSIIPLPDAETLAGYTKRVEKANLLFRTKLSQLTPRMNVVPRPVPERIGEPSVFKHVLYIIKENKTYDQVLGDMPQGDGMKSLCVFGDSVTPNQHQFAREFQLMDNYYASGKSSAEGHSWTDAAIVTDYVEKNVRAWYRSYGHVLTDALIYNKEGFLWNNALDHGKTVRIYGEACTPNLKKGLGWKEVYQLHKEGKQIPFENETTISRVRPIMSTTYPCYEGQSFADQIRADIFIKELAEYESLPGDAMPQLMIMALPADHTAGMREGFPTPRAAVADNDLAVGRIIEALSKSRFWDSTVVFITEDDSQSGWDHVSAYRTTGYVVSPYSRLQKTVHTNYNQTCIVRTIEQILGIPPMNVMDATALPMFDCFTDKIDRTPFTALRNRIPLDEMNKPANALSGKAKKFTLLSSSPMLAKIDSGNDDLLNRIIWYSTMGNKPYPKKMTIPKKDREDDDD
ncbi:MAG: phosphoesterase [Chitinophagaceae bacterium]|nr:MAG: phosphoesterase [Chitinophagaceae bacterium]